MSSLASLSSTPAHAGHLAAVARTAPIAAKAAASTNGSPAASASDDTTATTTNADGSLTITITNAAGAIVSIATSGGSGTGLTPAAAQNPLYTQAGNQTATQAAAALLNALV